MDGNQLYTMTDKPQPELHPPGNTPHRDVSDTQSYRWLWLSLAAVLVLGLLVIFALPGFVNQPQPGSATPAPAAVSTPAASAAANQAMQAWLQLRAQLELENVSRGGEPECSSG